MLFSTSPVLNLIRSSHSYVKAHVNNLAQKGMRGRCLVRFIIMVAFTILNGLISSECVSVFALTVRKFPIGIIFKPDSLKYIMN